MLIEDIIKRIHEKNTTKNIQQWTFLKLDQRATYPSLVCFISLSDQIFFLPFR